MTFHEGTEIEVTENGLEAFKVLDLLFDKKDGKYYLYSGTYKTRWPHRQRIEAKCKCKLAISKDPVEIYEAIPVPDPVPPMQGHMCGIHCERKLEQCINYVSTVICEDDKELLLGSLAVKLSIWGKVLEGEHGYRAQYAYPKAIYLPANKAEAIGAPVCDVYGCQIFTEESGDAYVTDVIEKMREASKGFKRLSVEETHKDVPVPLFIHELAKEDHSLGILGKQIEDEAYLNRVKDLIGFVKNDEAYKGRLIDGNKTKKTYPTQEVVDGETRND